MSESKEQKSSSGVFRWTPVQSRFLLRYLVEQIKEGQKTDKGFKAACLNKAAKAVSEQFNCNVLPCKVSNHLRTLRSRWVVIERIKSLSGAVTDDSTGIISFGEEAVEEYVKAHSDAEGLFNKPIENYKEMKACFSNESATGEFVRDSGRSGGPVSEENMSTTGQTSNQNPMEYANFSYDDDELDVLSTQQQTRVDPAEPSQGKKKGRKRSFVEDDVVGEEMAANLGRIANAVEHVGDGLKSIAKKVGLDEDHIMNEVTRIGGHVFGEDGLLDIGEILINNPSKARTFLAVNDRMKEIMMAKIFNI